VFTLIATAPDSNAAIGRNFRSLMACPRCAVRFVP
jgi:hypothetical protein